MLRSIVELAAYGTFAVLLTAASLAPETRTAASSATTNDTAFGQPAGVSTNRGALLFATKGCIGCHTHAAFPNARMQVGPDLTALPQRAGTRVADLDARAYVRQSLRDPRAYVVSGYTALMPDLHLSDTDIDSLSAFLLQSPP